MRPQRRAPSVDVTSLDLIGASLCPLLPGSVSFRQLTLTYKTSVSFNSADQNVVCTLFALSWSSFFEKFYFTFSMCRIAASRIVFLFLVTSCRQAGFLVCRGPYFRWPIMHICRSYCRILQCTLYFTVFSNKYVIFTFLHYCLYLQVAIGRDHVWLYLYLPI